MKDKTYKAVKENHGFLTISSVTIEDAKEIIKAGYPHFFQNGKWKLVNISKEMGKSCLVLRNRYKAFEFSFWDEKIDIDCTDNDSITFDEVNYDVKYQCYLKASELGYYVEGITLEYSKEQEQGDVLSGTTVHEQPSNTRELSDDEIYKCMLKGGKDKCSYKSKDAMACVMLRKCEYVKLIESTEQPTRGLSDEDHYIAYDMKFESGIKHTLIPPKPNKCPICGGLECGEGFCNNPFDKDGNPL